MPVTNYHTVNGRLIGETTSGVRTDYLTDALGSITATVNESAQIINTYRYKPFGERLAKTGSGADPRFQFTGDTGSVTTSRRYAENYNRRRSLDVKNGRWGSVDLFWPAEPAYAYAHMNPTTYEDASGLQTQAGSPGQPVGTRPPWLPIPTPEPPRPVPQKPSPRYPPDPVPKPTEHESPLELLIHLGKPGMVAFFVLLPCSAGSLTGIRWIFPFPKDLFGRPPGSKPKCQELYEEYKRSCEGIKKCTRCDQYAIGRLNQCLNMRMRYLLSCDVPGGGAAQPDLCKHAGEICKTLDKAKDCAALCIPDNEFGVPDYSLWLEWCKRMKQYCGSKGSFPT